MTEIIGYALSIVIGVSLGLIGGGGSILTVPILVYVFGLGPEISTSYSLFIVGLTALAGSVNYYRNKLVNLKAVLVFSIPSLISVFLTRKYIMPALPDVIFTVGSFQFTKPVFIMTVFAALMIAASVSMIRKSKVPDPSKIKPGHHYTLIFLEGAVVGILTGFVGAGGGFLIIPALVLLAGLPMKEAVGTSLLIIAIKSLIGFTGDLSAGVRIDWAFLALISSFTILGIYIGSTLSKKIHGDKLKPAFGWFVLAMGIYIMIRETLMK
ncbi:MAG TPA: sulfite exporter TauE/SafE family protein [Ignavibacteria bacterium]|nr:sulfite exporter TauE/SafE family protein [Ignavibacteria bacterium]